jgi:cupin 2 domain-containing protein
MVTHNILANLPVDLSEEVFEPLFSGSSARVERIVSLGHASPAGFWYDQEQHEWVLVIQGEAELEFADRNEPIRLRPGDTCQIPAHVRHRVAWTTPTEPTIWLAIHYDP